jgi:ubiquinone/menaquinone biosynthesis C-methylase UbiE
MLFKLLPVIKSFRIILLNWMDKIACWRAQKIIQYFPDNIRGRILDVGCGDGSVTNVLKEKNGLDVWGVDIVNNFQYKLPFQVCDGKYLPFRDNTFDAVLIIYVLHHSSDIEGILKECQRVSKGIIIIQEDVPTNVLSKWVSSAFDYLGNILLLSLAGLILPGGWQLMEVPFNFRTDEQWKECFRKIGLKLLEEKKVTFSRLDPVPHRQYIVHP